MASQATSASCGLEDSEGGTGNRSWEQEEGSSSNRGRWKERATQASRPQLPAEAALAAAKVRQLLLRRTAVIGIDRSVYRGHCHED